MQFRSLPVNTNFTAVFHQRMSGHDFVSTYLLNCVAIFYSFNFQTIDNTQKFMFQFFFFLLHFRRFIESSIFVLCIDHTRCINNYSLKTNILFHLIFNILCYSTQIISQTSHT